MRISGFTMLKNASKLYYPIKQSIMSILPIVDEYVVALGNCDEDDSSRREIESIGSPKIKIIDTIWNLEKYPRGMEHAHQTDIAKEACSGDWLFYLQADEVVHEKDHPAILKRCKELFDDKVVDGLLFKYYHFWGDYLHYHTSHGWYSHEIRIIRNKPDIHSWESAQSFRRIPGFDYVNYRQQEGTYKLNVAAVDAHIYHYGWVRPPNYMQAKRQAFDTNHKGRKRADEIYLNAPKEFDFGPLNLLKEFEGTHPEVMKEWINKFDWADKLQYNGQPNPYRKKEKHERLRIRLMTFLEQKILGGRQIFTFKNYKVLNK
jgi:hypothetical protein